MKKLILLLAIAFTVNNTFSQTPVVEKLQALSKNASKGYFYDAVQNPETGGIEVSYKFKGKSKDDKGTFETYYFDKDLNFSKQEETTVLKSDIADKPGYTKSYIYARVGGCTSFDILSTTLKLSKQTFEYKWNSDKKNFTRKRTEDVEIKPKNDDKRTFSGYDVFNAGDYAMVLVSSETKGEDKKMRKDFILLRVGIDLSIKEMPLPLDASQLVYSTVMENGNSNTDSETDDDCELCNSDMVFVFAPTFDKKNPTDYKKYTYLKVDKNGVVKENVKIDAPAANLIITGVAQAKDGATYLFGSYNKEEKTFDQLYKEYSPLPNPCYTNGVNYRMDTYERATEKMEMDFVTLIKMNNGKTEWIKNTSVEDLAKVVKTPAGQKKASAYTGKRLKIQYFNVLPNNDIFISGQLVGSEMMDKAYWKTYKDVICLQFTSKGEIVAQYGAKPESIDDKQNIIFSIPQFFYPNADGSVVYWNLLETNVFKGYADFWDAYNGDATFYRNFHPSMIKINAATKEIMDYQEIGKRKYLLNQHCPFIYNEKDGTIIYIGSDKKSNLWLAKYTMGK